MNQRLQKTIQCLLEFLSKDAGGLASELEYKGTKLESSQTTAQKLQGKYEERMAEFEKIKTLDVKISQELEQLAQKKEQMLEEMKTFDDVDGLRKRMDTAQVKLTAMKKTAQGRRDALKKQLAQMSGKKDALKQRLSVGDAASTVEALEQKMRHYEQNIFHLRDYIEGKERESDYSAALNDVSTLVADINEM